MSVPLSVLDSPRLKVERAYRHIDELRSRSSPLDRSLYTLGAERHTQYEADIDAMIPGIRIMYRPVQPIGKIFALIIGDALHNLRSALDHLATGIARHADPKAQIHFPMAVIREDLVPGTRTKGGSFDKAFAALEKALPGSENLILNDIRPANGGNEHLWAFHRLNNDDKHNLIVPTVTVTAISNLNMRAYGVTTRNFTSGGDATQPFSLLFTDEPVTIEDNFETAVDVRLAHVDALKNEPVVPTLTQIAEIVTETIKAFERLIRR